MPKRLRKATRVVLYKDLGGKNEVDLTKAYVVSAYGGCSLS